MFISKVRHTVGDFDQLKMYCLFFKIWIKIFVIFILFSEKKRNQPIWHKDISILY